MLERKKGSELDNPKYRKRYSVLWTDDKMIYAKVYIETWHGSIGGIHIKDPEASVYLGQAAVHVPQLTLEFEHWRSIAKFFADRCRVKMIVEEIEDCDKEQKSEEVKE